MHRREAWQAGVLWTPCGATVGAAVVFWLCGYRRLAVTLLTALLGGVLGVFLERLARGQFDVRWLVRHLVVPAALTALAVDDDGAWEDAREAVGV